jgi:uncharacterized coiled-coil protein SlyX
MTEFCGSSDFCNKCINNPNGDKNKMDKDEMKNKYSAFITEISEILGLGKPVDILKLCATTDLFFQPLEKRIAELEKENEIFKKANEIIAQQRDDRDADISKLENRIEELEERLRYAKEIIEGLMRFCRCFAQHHTEDIRYKEAEQFLKEK